MRKSEDMSRFKVVTCCNDLFLAEKFEYENDIAPQRPELLMEKWYEFKEELLKKVGRVE